MTVLTLEGVDNRGRPRQEFADHVASLDDEDFVREAEQFIWLSAYASNNRRSDFHWQADACYREAKRRGRPELYRRAYDRASGAS